MAFANHRGGFPAIAASAINYGAAVTLDTGDVQRQVVPVATLNAEPCGIAQATAGQGEPVTVHDAALGNVVKIVAIASLGHGADIGVASTNGGLAGITGASGTLKWAVGKSLTAAAAGETFSLYFRPRIVSGTTP